ncbi:MAG: DUF3592 domain-containing protein [Chitinophagaceae bacterium]|jgi:hypothetical protein|nr:DUF3592 domain-containing protein [Chitinophagaceae bacterium]
MLTSILFIVISLFVVIIGLKLLSTIKAISKQGIEAEGIIFDIEPSSFNANDTNANDTTIFYPVVRFLTANEKWITKASKISSLPGVYKKGSKITVVYQKDNPNNFFIKDKLTYFIPALLIGIGICFIVTGIIFLFHKIA